MKYVKN